MNTPPPVAPLLILNLQMGMDYLSELTLANPVVAEQQLMRFIDSLLTTPPAPDILLTLLEQARIPICFVEEEMSRLYHNKPLVLNEAEEASFQKVVNAWQKLYRVYALCAHLNSPATDDTEHSAILAAVLHRCIYYKGMIVLEHYRARREQPEGIWHDLHKLYEAAEVRGIAYTPVEDSLENNFHATHCAAAYATVLLTDIAGPYSNSVRNLNLIRRWASMWAPLISIHQLDDELEIPPYIVELNKDAPLHPSALADEPGIDARRLDTTRLGLQINHMLSQLRQRISASQLGLGEETSGYVTELLERLSRPWTQSVSPRRFRRFPSAGIARIAVGFDAMHYFVTGKTFTQPTSASTYSRGEFEQLFTFGDRVNPMLKLNIEPDAKYPFDEWSVINHSANGFRLACNNPQERLRHGQLLAICPHDGEQFLLAQVNWLMQEISGAIVLGISILPGLPRGVGVRIESTNETTVSDHLTRTFLLPAVPAFKEEASIVLPSGMYHTTRTLKVFSGKNHWLIRMSHIIHRGTDFDRIGYEMLDLSSSGTR